MMTSKERINRILNFKTPDRIGAKDLFWNETRTSWQGMLNEDLEDHFNFDIRILDIESPPGDSELEEFFLGRNRDRFLAIAFREPFQQYVDRIGWEIALENIGLNPRAVFDEFKKNLDEVLPRALEILDKAYEYDGVWLFGDLAHSRGLVFSPEFYDDYLFPFHKSICSFFASHGIPTILHSDGDISRLIPKLIKAGVRALHPLQYSSGLNLIHLKREYGKDLVFFGNFDIDTLKFPRRVLEELMAQRLEVFKDGGGYIFGLDGPIGPDAKLEDYEFVLDLVDRYGRY